MTAVCPPLRVLVVEDEPLLAIDLEMMVEESGHVIVGEARCLDSAMALGDDINPHLALVDLHLAKQTSGLDVLIMIQRRWPGAAVIFITANPGSIPEDFGGAHGVVAKPFSQRGMTATLRYLTEGLCDPPPRIALPECLVTSPAVVTLWGS